MTNKSVLIFYNKDCKTGIKLNICASLFESLSANFQDNLHKSTENSSNKKPPLYFAKNPRVNLFKIREVINGPFLKATLFYGKENSKSLSG